MDEDDAAAITFGTDGWRATLDEFTAPRVRMVGQAVAATLRERGEMGTVAVGYDARETSRGFAEELSRVLCANGFDVLVPDRDTPTPVVAWTVTERGLAGALQITASHNPPEYNGVKFIPSSGAPGLPETTEEIVSNLADPESLPEDEWGSVTEEDLVADYADHAIEYADADLEGLSVAYDAMHGSGRGVTNALLERAGADVTAMRDARDPDFGGGSPEPTAENVEELIRRVREGDADLGVVNDGDADRLGVVTPDRGYLDPNLYFAAMYDYLLETRSGDVVRTVSTSSIVDRVAEAHGQSVHETAVGFKWVAQAMADHDALMGGEESGGFGLADHLRNKDGVLLALVTAAADSEESLDDRVDRLLADHGEIHQGRISVDCPEERKAPVLDELEAALPESVAGESVEGVNTVDGFKIGLADGTWVLVRPSGTEPKLRVYAEAGSGERLDELLSAGRELVAPLI
ncbi:phosphoglucomutase/phosphomannomutase family protein [Haloarcula nitratireducens]|uniref:Phosphoglucomutase/phosphomannomutase family protein n=1 Tax=Haloarcula nitratireducens TaxID=2487749 RepID=A0AAW4PC75_9EURY|nr:phosphoglucomutase/phosphomannomutase family protein [Halomicroarcula nitratireducens]MBX0295577.1 phosphoglucomutase/phosphomannomutase family protein [Halomicroarcula nitratireducens]